MNQILIVDDEEKMRHLLAIILESRGYKVIQAADGVNAFDIINENAFDMVISDIKMPRMDGLELLEKMKANHITCPVVFITAFATIDSAVEAMRRGAADYITKPFEEDRILLTVERTLNFSRIISENRDLKQRLQKAEAGHEIIFKSQTMAAVMDMAGRVAKTDSAVLINGESGTGKELIARYIHRMSPRNEKRFVPVNCAAISSNLVESELFGHEKGAFTGADKKAEGKFEYASGGTIFLDEIGDLPLEAQAKLLRALQEKRIQRVGGNDEVPVDVRVICATNKNLSQQVEKEDFRQDLLFRINVFPIQPPPLRDRMEDVEILFDYFLKKLGAARSVKLDKSGLNALKSYLWPGNVRELANAAERAVILAGDKGQITGDTLSFLNSGQTRDCVPIPADEYKLPRTGIILEEFENNLVRQALEMSENNQTLASKLLGITRSKFRVLMKQYKENRKTGRA
ncbi:Two component system response regulator, sigma54-specific [Desulfonema limicola]|uniref:Two component system response regulator, sigma54-specific n=1 Tax=Desulfonema limicola TaxID=45656 RepID=A0A975GGT5_9BACT|nr:sigma-54 dependent transcriptional regulator [Desulfonema limicola]QTA80609.1 Two component system response regulator, sigma54-specific [Desulfonema limicola]